MDTSPHLIYPHLAEGEGHALLYVWPLFILLLEDIAGEEGGGRDHVVLLKKKKQSTESVRQNGFSLIFNEDSPSEEWGGEMVGLKTGGGMT